MARRDLAIYHSVVRKPQHWQDLEDRADRCPGCLYAALDELANVFARRRADAPCSRRQLADTLVNPF